MVMSGRSATTTSPSLIFCLSDFPVGISASSDFTPIVPRGDSTTRGAARHIVVDRVTRRPALKHAARSVASDVLRNCSIGSCLSYARRPGVPPDSASSQAALGAQLFGIVGAPSALWNERRGLAMVSWRRDFEWVP